MNEVEEKLHRAFDDIHAPDGLNSKTLERIEAQRTQQEAPQPVVKVHRKRRTGIAITAVAACLIVIAALFGISTAPVPEPGPVVSTVPTAFVDIDVNPSIELSLDSDNVVLDAIALNDDAEAVLSTVDLKGETYSDALVRLQADETFSSFLSDTSFMEITIIGADDQQRAALDSQSTSYLSGLPCEGTCSSATAEEHAEAQAAGMGVGKYRAAQQLHSLDPATSIESCSDMTMRQLKDAIEAHGGDVEGLGHGAQSGTGAQGGNGYGNATHDKSGSQHR